MKAIRPLLRIQPLPHVTDDQVSREAQRQQLHVGQLLRASVTEGGQDHVTLAWGQDRFRAETRIPFRIGQTLELLVVATSPHIELRLLGDSLGERLSQYLQTLNGKWHFFSAAEDLSGVAGGRSGPSGQDPSAFLELWRQACEGLSRSPSAEALRHVLTTLGLGHEADLAREGLSAFSPNLKSALLEVLHRAGSLDPELEEAFTQQLRLLEFFQLSQVRLGAQGMTLYPLPLSFLDQGFLLARNKHGEEEAESSALVSLHLQLKGLGGLRIDLLEEGGGTLVRFACEDQEKADYIAAFRDELEQILEGLPLEGLSFSVGAKSPDRDLVEMLQPKEGCFLNTRA